MYQATGSITYLTRALGWATTMVSLATITDNQGYLNWTGDDTSLTYASVPISNALDDFQSSVPLAVLADLVVNTPTLDATYDSQARTIQTFVAHNIIEKHICSLGRNENYNFVIGQFTSDKVAMLMRILRHATNVDPAINCSGTTYLSTLLTWMTAYHTRFTLYGVGSLMDRGLSQYSNRHYSSTDTSHGNRYPYAAMDDYRAGNVFTKNDMTLMALDFYGEIWNHSTTNPEFSNFIDGTNQPFYNCDATSVCTPSSAYGAGVIYSGWIALGEIDRTVQYVGDKTLRVILATPGLNQSISAMNSVWGILELAGHAAKNLVTT